MKNQIECYIVHDLLPNYIERVTTEETNKDIEAHLETCVNCNTEYQEMIKDLDVEKIKDLKEIKKVRDGLTKTKRMYVLRGILEATALVAFLVPGIVNLAVNHCFTWYYIVCASLLWVSAVTVIAVFKKKRKVVSSIAAGSILGLPLLFVIEIVINNCLSTTPVSWFFELGLPIYVVWFIILWFTISLFCFAKIKKAYCVAASFGFAAIGSFITNDIIINDSNRSVFQSNWISFLVCGIGMIAAIVIGSCQSSKN